MYEWLGFADDEDDDENDDEDDDENDDDVDDGDVDGDGWTMVPKLSEMFLSSFNSVSMIDSELSGLMLPESLFTDEVDSLEETDP